MHVSASTLYMVMMEEGFHLLFPPDLEPGLKAQVSHVHSSILELCLVH